VKRLFIEDEFFAPAQGTPPMAVKKIPHLRHKAAILP
jgi:hypothetical protein